MDKGIYFEGDDEVMPFNKSTPIPTPKVDKPVDELAFIDVEPNTIWYLSIIRPHIDSHELFGPAKAFRHLLPQIEDVVSNSPPAIDKLAVIKEKPNDDFLFEDDEDEEKEVDEEFLEKGFDTFIVEGQRGVYTILKMHREINKDVFDILPAPVYTIISAGPLAHAEHSSSTSLSSKFEASKPKGYAATTKLHASYVDRADAKEDAEHIFTVLLLDTEDVKKTKRWEKGTKGGGILIGMNASSMWEVKILYMDDPIGRAQEEADREHDGFVL
ncbi:hypothetical protein J4E89_000827 [Alternaria sp. Ai002NY15]|nr:hypothetical protein J4E89_000827 [Alternaria sp. Ai002NY15]